MRAIFPLIAVAGLSLGACAPYDVGLGESVRHHMALQVIDPHPEQQTELVEGGDGQRSAEAVKRYREGKVKEPVAIKTSTATTAGGSGGGSPK
jgi:hypothetical protein